MRSRNSRHDPAANQLDLLSFRAAFRLVRFVFGEGPGGCGGIFPRGQQAGARVRKRRREGNEWTARVERRYTIQRTIRWLKNRCQVGPTILFECPAQIPRSSLRSFSLWAQPWSFSFRPIMRFLVIGILYVIASAFKGLHRISFEIQQPTVRCDKCKYLVASYLW